MNIKNKRIYENYISFTKDIRESFNCDHRDFPIKIWEALLFIFLCFSTEILNLLAYPKLKNLADTNNGFAQAFFNTFPLNTILFWTILLKAIIGQIMCIYLTIRYYEKKLTTQIWLFWSLQSMIPAMNHLGKNVSIIQNISPILTMGMWMFFFLYFFAMDPCHINSLKLLFYSNVIIDPETGKVHKTPNSEISKPKLKKTCIWVLALLGCSIFVTNVLKHLIDIIFGQHKDATGSSEPKNQQEILKKAKENIFIIAISTIIMAPIIEEWMFRRFLMKMGKFKWWTIVISGFLFGLSHLKTAESPIHLVPYVTPGLIFGAGMYLSKNIWHTIITHALHNAAVVIMMIFTQL